MNPPDTRQTRPIPVVSYEEVRQQAIARNQARGSGGAAVRERALDRFVAPRLREDWDAPRRVF